MNNFQKFAISAVFLCVSTVSVQADECCGSGMIPPQPDIIVDAPRPANDTGTTTAPVGQVDGFMSDLPPNFGWSVGASVILSILVNTRSASGSF